MLKLLFIEDQPAAIRSVRNLIEKEKKEIQCEEVGFEDAQEKIASFRPDIVILDLLVGGASPGEKEPVGLQTRNFIWDNKHFCPIVIYSAQPEVHDDDHDPHPFVKSIKKGSYTEQKVLSAVCEFLPHVHALKEAERAIANSFSVAMREVAPYAFEAFSDDTQRIDTITRSGRRRLAALMDDPPANERSLASWEQYLFPPVSEDIQLGDILRKDDAPRDDPASFRIVLTPSCDLATSEDRTPKIAKVLVARCCSIKESLALIGWEEIRENKLKERLPDILTQGYFKTIIPFPSLKNRIPTMAANLRDLELIPVKAIGESNKPFLRVASLDSPFRELISWAYMQTAGRPGLPDRAFDSWRKEIIDDLRSGDGTEEA